MNNLIYMDINSFTYQIEILRSIRKSISVEVIDKYKLRVKSPIFLLDSVIKDFIISKTKWIENHNSKVIDIKKTFSISNLSEIPYLGNNLTVISSSTHKKAKVENGNLFIPINKDIKTQVINWYKKEAREIITNELQYFSPQIGVNYNRVFIKSQKSRWGSCSSRMNLNFNWKIILTKPELLRYLVIHELCHLKEMNHSKKFWNLVKKFDGNFMNHRKELQRYSHYLLYFPN